MAGAGDMNASDLERLTWLIEDARRDDAGPILPWSLLDGLRALIPADAVWFDEFDYLHPSRVAFQCVGEGERGDFGGMAAGSDEATEWMKHFWRSSCSYPQRTGDLTTVLLSTDFASIRQRRQDPLYVDLLAGYGVLHDVIVSLPAPTGRYRRVLLSRHRDTSFTERDRRLLGLVRPHLNEIWLRSQRRRAGAPHLTNREWQVLRLVGAGLSNTDIATHLFVSTATVRKHLENIYSHLEVRTRTAAATTALPFDPHLSHTPTDSGSNST